ncbi:MAG: hypothetical protein Q9M14_06710 [Mariprofundaceae bacterium]|nr:hypothetical protein [Mariprofundaceae bacterium]
MSGGTQMFWGTDEGAGKSKTHAQIQADSRPALDVPPSLRGEVEVPDAGAIAVQKALPERYKKITKGKKVSLDARLYDASIGDVFSSVVDAMGSLNLPVQSVDSASGTVTTDWVRTDANNPSMNSLLNVFGGGGPQAIRYRYLARVLRESSEEVVKTRLEIRTMGQAFSSGHWVNKKLTRKRADELFSRVEELLAK